jgi:branched-chain amino acid transport system substrate-binding protein
MLRKRSWIFNVLCVFGLFLSLASMALAAEKVVKIGAICPLTGPNVDNGTEVKRGIELAVKLQNQAGGIQIGREKVPIEVIWGDSESKVEAGLSVADKLITVDKIDVATGFFHSHVSCPSWISFRLIVFPPSIVAQPR